MKFKIILLILLFVNFTFYSSIKHNSEDYESYVKKYLSIWNHLEKIELDNNVIILFNKTVCDIDYNNNQNTKIINKQKILSFKPKENSNSFDIHFRSGPLPFFDSIEIKLQNNTIYNLKVICIPGNGSIYTLRTAYAWNLLVEDKYIYENETLKLVNQPFYYVGKETKTNIQIILLSSIDGNQIVATIPKSYKVFLIGLYQEKPDSDIWFLVKSVSGLVGWVKMEFIDYKYQESIGNLDIITDYYP